MMAAALIQGAAGFVAYLAAVLWLIRALRDADPAAVVLLTAVAVWLGTLAALLAFGQRVNVWAYATSYFFWVLCFLMVFGALYKSISLRILRDLLGKPQRAMQYSDLARSVVDESYSSRLLVMEEKGLAVRCGDRYQLTERGRRIARRMSAVQQLFGIERSG